MAKLLTSKKEEEVKKKKKLQSIVKEPQVLKKKKKKKLLPIVIEEEEAEREEENVKAFPLTMGEDKDTIIIKIMEKMAKARKRLAKKLKEGYKQGIAIFHNVDDFREAEKELEFFTHYKPEYLYKIKNPTEEVSILVYRKRKVDEPYKKKKR